MGDFQSKRLFPIVLLLLTFFILWSAGSLAEVQRTGPLMTVPAISMRKEWRQFRILVWPYTTDVIKDYMLYQKAGFGGFEIDRGAGQDEKVDFSLTHNLPYYVDHTADKGYLYLKEHYQRNVTGKRGLATRPNSLADPQTLATMKGHLERNIQTTKRGLVLAYAFDDEISLGHFTAPCDVDIHPLSVEWFRVWLQKEYKEIGGLNEQWGTSFKNFADIIPIGFEQIRHKAVKPPLSKWNLSAWMDFRHFMDYQFSSTLSELTLYANMLDPQTPAGFVGGQEPSPWGGYDYALLSRAVQWMEAYDVHATNEILRSFWDKERRPRMQTFFSTKDPKLDSWFLWYYMLHGNQAVIAWPDGWFNSEGQEIAPYIGANKETFEEIQGKVSEPIADPNTRFDPDPIGIYYSHPSIQAGWAMDAITHGDTWINRSSSLDGENQSMGVLRKVWCKTLEDLGFQYDFISYLDVQEKVVDLNSRFRVIILPKAVCLSDAEAKALKEFVEGGGTLVADYLCGLLDGHGKGRPRGALDDLFGIERSESRGYMNGKGLTEIDCERYERPFPERFPLYEGASRYNGIVVFERGARKAKGAEDIKARWRTHVCIARNTGKGRAVYLNLTPLEYWSPQRRFSEYGDQWRGIISGILDDAGLTPRVRIYEKEEGGGEAVAMIEPLFWKNGGRRYLGIVKNPTQDREAEKINGTHTPEGITGNPVTIRMEFRETVRLMDLRFNKDMGTGKTFTDILRPWEGNLYEIIPAG